MRSFGSGVCVCVCVCVVVHVCVSVLQAASCGELAGRMYGGYDSPNVCIDPSFLPPMLVNRWSGDRQARGLRKNERKRGGAKKREKKEDCETEGREPSTPCNELQI